MTKFLWVWTQKELLNHRTQNKTGSTEKCNHIKNDISVSFFNLDWTCKGLEKEKILQAVGFEPTRTYVQKNLSLPP